MTTQTKTQTSIITQNARIPHISNLWQIAVQVLILWVVARTVLRGSGAEFGAVADTGVLALCVGINYVVYLFGQTNRLWYVWMVLAIALFSVFPFYYAILTSLESGTAIFEVNYLPDSFSIGNYVSVFRNNYFAYNLLNSVIVASVVVCLSLLLAVTASFSLSRIRFRGRGILLLTILSVSMFPQISVLSGLFELISIFGLFNHLGSLIFSYMIFTLPFTVWVLTAFMRELPLELEEAAIMDGAGPLRIIFKVFMPLLWPSLITTGLLAFIAAWNEFLFALTFILRDTQRTVPVAIALLSGTTEREIPWGNIMAASVIVTVPLVIMVLVFQQRIISGLTAGAVKG